MTQGCICPPTCELTCKATTCPRRAVKPSDWANSKEREDFLDRAYFEGRMSGHIRPGGHMTVGGGSHPSFVERNYDPGRIYSTTEDLGDWNPDVAPDHGKQSGR